MPRPFLTLPVSRIRMFGNVQDEELTVSTICSNNVLEARGFLDYRFANHLLQLDAHAIVVLCYALRNELRAEFDNSSELLDSFSNDKLVVPLAEHRRFRLANGIVSNILRGVKIGGRLTYGNGGVGSTSS